MTNSLGRFVARHQGAILRIVLGSVFALFIGILVTVYFVAREANPVMLDEHSAPIGAPAASR